MIASCRSGLLHRHRSRSLTLLGLIGLCLLLHCSGGKDNEPQPSNEPRPPQGTASGTGDLDARVFPPDSLPFGKDYGAWSAEWWQWAFSMPASENPLLDETGKNVSQHNVVQPGSWLAGPSSWGAPRATVPCPKAQRFSAPFSR